MLRVRQVFKRLCLARRLSFPLTSVCTYTQLVNNMLREQRISIADPVLSEDPEGNRRRLKVVFRALSRARRARRARALSRSLARSLAGPNEHLFYALQGRAERLRETARRVERESGWHERRRGACVCVRAALSGKVRGMKDDVVRARVCMTRTAPNSTYIYVCVYRSFACNWGAITRSRRTSTPLKDRRRGTRVA